MKAYKVVRTFKVKGKTKHTSACEMAHFLTYSRNKVTKAPKNCGPIFVFRTAYEAKRFASRANGLQVWEVDAPMLLNAARFHSKGSLIGVGAFPKGTAFAKRVTLKKKIKIE